jgi:hypothetical protein
VAYNKVQFIAHCLFTAPNHVWDDKSGMWKDSYNGLGTDVEDVKKRVELVKAAITKASQSADTKADVLKVFMMPECFFQGKQGAYSIADATAAVEQLQGLVSDKAWSDWIFAFGSIDGSYEVGSTTEIANLVPVVKGGYGSPTLASGNSVLLQKALFCKDLVDEAHLQGGGLTSDKAKFGTTQNEERLARLVRHILAPAQESAVSAVFKSGGGTAEGWARLRNKLATALEKLGDTAVVRGIRAVPMPTDFEWDHDWWPVAKKLVLAVGPAIKNIGSRAAGQDKAKFKEIVGALTDPTNAKTAEALTSAGFPPTRWPAMREQLAKSLADDPLLDSIFKSLSSYELFTRQAWDQDWMGATKRLLDLFLTQHAPVPIYGTSTSQVEAKEKSVLLAEQNRSMFNPDDFRFSFDSVKGPGDKKLEFGLEICADHGSARLKSALAAAKTGAKTVDIQLVVSAGIGIANGGLAVRPQGYAFNSDGWTVPAAYRNEFKGVEEPVSFENPKKEKETFTPHSEVRRAGSTTALAPVSSLPLDDTLAAEIFAKGAGKLHVYPPLDL